MAVPDQDVKDRATPVTDLNHKRREVPFEEHSRQWQRVPSQRDRLVVVRECIGVCENVLIVSAVHCGHDVKVVGVLRVSRGVALEEGSVTMVDTPSRGLGMSGMSTPKFSL